ncbi:MAG: PQQ-dependent sugar dehydrogenase [bacterium]|nr:MAG: PQQ-dependent sugar dehydrogenase [bacterium]
MKSFLVWTILILGVIGGSYFVVSKYFPQVLPQFIPVSKEVKQHFPLSNETFSPFKIPSGYSMDIFADLKNDLPRVLEFDSNGNLIVSITSKGKILALTDDSVTELLTGLNKPHGIAFNENYIYIAETDGVSRYLYNSQNLEIGKKEFLFSLPSGGRHFTRTIKINNGKLYTSVGSSCDTCLETNPHSATILVSSLDGSDLKVFARGLRNTVFFDFDSQGNMWGADMGRDNLGDNLPPEEVNLIKEGLDYGWPYCYGNRVKDTKFNSDKTITCEQTEPPVFEMPAHTAPLGFIFDSSGNILVALHGSWNSTQPVGYKVVKLTTFANSITGMEDFVTGFIQDNGQILGRPAGLAYDRNGNLYIGDDKTGLIYILKK